MPTERELWMTPEEIDDIYETEIRHQRQRAETAEAALAAERQARQAAEQQRDYVRETMYASVVACQRAGCEHCKWLGLQIGTLDQQHDGGRTAIDEAWRQESERVKTAEQQRVRSLLPGPWIVARTGGSPASRPEP